MSRRIFFVSRASCARLVGSLFLITYDVATSAAPGTSEIMSGEARRATPTFRIVLLIEFGLMRSPMGFAKVPVSTPAATSALVLETLFRDSALEEIILFGRTPSPLLPVGR